MRQHAAATDIPELNVAKLREMICFFASRGNAPGKLNLGKTKLMKLLYYADFGYFAEHSKPISGAAYTKYPRGPVPEDALRQLPQMVEDGLLHQEIEKWNGYVQESHLVVEECVSSLLNPQEIAFLGEVWARWGDKNTTDIVSASHSEAPWKSVNMYETIPYEMAYFL